MPFPSPHRRETDAALKMHEGEKVEEKWDEDKYRAEDDVRRVGDEVEYIPQNVDNCEFCSRSV